MNHQLDQSPRFIVILDDLLTPAECAHFIDKFRTEPVEHVDRAYMAQYDRTTIISDSLADDIFRRIQRRVRLPDSPSPIRCNDHFRLSRYKPGEEFKLHTDGVNQDRFGYRSRYTVNIFLNAGDFTGGETCFLPEGRRITAVPKPGRAAIFDREILHCWNLVGPGGKGHKYLLRTDIMVS